MEPNTQAAPVEAPQTNDDKIGSLARGFLDEVEQNDDPDQMQHQEPQEDGEPESSEEVAEQTDEEAETPPPEPEVPVIEYELDDGQKVKVPESVKPHLMRDKDYRQKTMALSETRKQAEQLISQAQQVATQAQQLAPYHAQLYSMDARAQQIQQALTGDLLSNDPVEFTRAQGELAILLRNRDQLAQGLHGQMAQLSAQQQHLLQQKLAMDAPKLFEEIPDIGKPETQELLSKYARESGLSQEEIAHANFSAAAVKLLWKAKQFDAMVKEQAATKAKLKETVKTLPAASKSGRSVDTQGRDKQLRSDWRKDGGKIDSPAFGQMLRARMRGK